MSCMPPNLLEHFGPRLRLLRISAGYRSREALAETTEITACAVKHYETGVYLPRVPVLCQIADACATSTDVLLGRLPVDVRPAQTHVRRHVQALIDSSPEAAVEAVRAVLIAFRRDSLSP